MDHQHSFLLDNCSPKSQAALAAWARREGKSAAMSEDLVRSTERRVRRDAAHSIDARSGAFCSRCLASATIGAALALLLDRMIIGG